MSKKNRRNFLKTATTAVASLLIAACSVTGISTSLIDKDTINIKQTVAPIAIIGAMSEETKILTENLIDAKVTEIAGVKMHSGTISGVPVVVTQSGIGKVNASIATTLVIQNFSPKAVINTGSAGGLGEGLKVGDIVIGKSVTHHDVEVTAFGYKLGQMAQMPEYYVSDKDMLIQAQKSAKVFPHANIHLGQIVSGDQFISDSKKLNTIKKSFPKAQAVEMEAAAIAQTCHRFDVPFVVIRAISDLANEEANVSFDTFIKQAGKHSAEMVMEMIKVSSM